MVRNNYDCRLLAHTFSNYNLIYHLRYVNQAPLKKLKYFANKGCHVKLIFNCDTVRIQQSICSTMYDVNIIKFVTEIILFRRP